MKVGIRHAAAASYVVAICAIVMLAWSAWRAWTAYIRADGLDFVFNSALMLPVSLTIAALAIRMAVLVRRAELKTRR